MNNVMPGNAEFAYTFAGTHLMLGVAQDQLLTLEKISPDPFESSVNNYFKSMKEIETEFLASMNAAKSSLRSLISDLNYFSQHLTVSDNVHPYPDDLAHRHLEENY
ncbi:MAG: hypothetical protein ABW019_05785 [Chitinophagaceae bacterium]